MTNKIPTLLALTVFALPPVSQLGAATLTQHWLLNEQIPTLNPGHEPQGDRVVSASLTNQVPGGQAGLFVKGTSVDDPAPFYGTASAGAALNGSTGAIGTAFKDSHIELGPVAPESDPFTIALWFQRDGSASIDGLHSQFHIIGANQGQANRWSVHAQNLNAETGQFNLSLFHHGGWNNGSNSLTIATLQSDTWHHLALTRDADNNFDIYLDGAHVHGGTNFNPFTQGDNGVIVGRDAVLRETNNWSFLGLFDDIRFYDDALSAPQIAALAIPEPSTYALVFGIAALGGAFLVRRSRRALPR